jgi:hypothetical protein
MKQLPQIIAICGRRRTGKDVIADYICNKYQYSNVKFAQPLKDAIKVLFGFSEDQIEKYKDKDDDFWKTSPRKVMQFIGTEIMQYEIQRLIPHTNRHFFVNSLLKRHNNQNIVISDMRFLHEYNEIKKKGALVIKVIRPFSEKDNNIDFHSSEKEVDEITTDYTIINDGDINTLYKKIEKVILHYKARDYLLDMTPEVE